jgi:hypothetical protein
MLQYKRNTDVIRGPYNANRQSRYVELVLVVDNKEYKELGESREKVNHHCKEIANIINAVSDNSTSEIMLHEWHFFMLRSNINAN